MGDSSWRIPELAFSSLCPPSVYSLSNALSPREREESEREGCVPLNEAIPPLIFFLIYNYIERKKKAHCPSLAERTPEGAKKKKNEQSNSLGIPPHKVRADTKRIRLTISFFFCFGEWNAGYPLSSLFFHSLLSRSSFFGNFNLLKLISSIYNINRKEISAVRGMRYALARARAKASGKQASPPQGKLQLRVMRKLKQPIKQKEMNF